MPVAQAAVRAAGRRDSGRAAGLRVAVAAPVAPGQRPAAPVAAQARGARRGGGGGGRQRWRWWWCGERRRGRDGRRGGRAVVAAARAPATAVRPAAARAAAGGRGGRRRAGSGGRGGAGGTGTGGTGGGLPPVTVWIAGDSTVQSSGGTPCPIGWGGPFPMSFTAAVTVKNSAVGGRSVRTWLYNVQTTMDASGECVLARDANGNPTLQSRWSGDAERDVGDEGGRLPVHPVRDQRQLGHLRSPRRPDAFKESYGVMAKAAKERGAHPIFVTPLSMIRSSATSASPPASRYVTATKDAGTQFGVPVIDLHGLSSRSTSSTRSARSRAAMSARRPPARSATSSATITPTFRRRARSKSPAWWPRRCAIRASRLPRI